MTKENISKIIALIEKKITSRIYKVVVGDRILTEAEVRKLAENK